MIVGCFRISKAEYKKKLSEDHHTISSLFLRLKMLIIITKVETVQQLNRIISWFLGWFKFQTRLKSLPSLSAPPNFISKLLQFIPKLFPNCPQCVPKLYLIHPEINPKASLNRPQTFPKSSQMHPQIIPDASPKCLQISPLLKILTGLNVKQQNKKSRL